MTPEKEVPQEEGTRKAVIEAGCLLVKLPGSHKAYAVIMPQDKMAILLNYAAVLCDGPMQLAPFDGVDFKPRPEEKAPETLVYHRHYAGAKLYADQTGLKNWKYLKEVYQLKGLKDRKVIVLGKHAEDPEAEAIIMEAKLHELDLQLVEEW